MILPLQLRPGPVTAPPPAAWFLPGDSSARWLDELTRCGLARTETRLFLVPRSAADRTPAGLLVLPGTGSPLNVSPAGVACRSIAGRLFVPQDAVLHPPITDAEARALCSLPVAFFHPALGLSGFEEDATRRVWDLLELPEESPAHWNLARPGVAPAPPLTAVVLTQPPSLEELFGGAHQEIGTESPDDLPSAPGEPRDDAWSQARRNLQRLLARGLGGALRRLPHTGSRRTWINDLEGWAHRQMHAVSEQLEKLRTKELRRLLHLLDTDPEAGLRHAVPMNDFAHRGLAPPGARLGPRSMEFDPSRLGGRPADLWHAPHDILENLRRRYRKLADRELRLGRHRRAAYIYAELLGDLLSAANALKQGRLFREAALLYEEHLKNPLEAARCLAEAGLLTEAIERYEKLGRWLEVADLHERLGHTEEAVAALRRVVAERLEQDDVLGAAQLVDERLRAPEEAVELLLGAWPSSRQAAGCVATLFRILARLGQHAVALERLGRFARDPVPQGLVLPLLMALGGPARDYPDTRVRHHATDVSRVLIARRLQAPGLPTDEASHLVACLTHLAPEDRLLVRDGNRHLAERRSVEHRAQRANPPPLPGSLPTLHRRFELPRQIQWLRLRREWHWFFALGITPKRLTLLRGVWEGEFQSVSWECPAETVRGGLVFEPTGERGASVALATLSGSPLCLQRFPAADAFFGQECLAGTPSWLAQGSAPYAFGEDAAWSVHVAAGCGILSCHDKRGLLRRTIDVTDALLREAQRGPATRLCLAALSNGAAAIALGNRLVLTREDGRLERVELPGQVVGLCPTLPYARQGVALMLEHGAVMYWCGAGGLIELDRDVASPMGAFVPGGPLVLISGSRAVLLEVDSRGVQSVRRMELPGQRPVGVSATDSPGQFAVLGAQGEMSLYRMPR